MVLRNASNLPWVLRDVRWLHRSEHHAWRWRVGFVHHRDQRGEGLFLGGTGPGATPVHLEGGVLLPGQEVTVPLSLTPQRRGLHPLAIYAERLGSLEDVLYPDLSDALPALPAPLWFRPPKPPTAGRPTSRPTWAALRSSCTSLAEPSGQSIRVHVDVAAIEDATATGRLSRAQAASRLGLSADAPDTHGYWKPSLEAWVFVTGDRAAALQRDRGEWRTVALPNMDALSAEVLGATRGGVTLAALPRGMADGLALLDDVRPARATGRDVYAIGPAALWKTFGRLEKKIGVVAVTLVRERGQFLTLDVAVTPDAPAERCE